MNKFHTLQCRGELVKIDSPVVMGILNVTPDSFYKESRVGDSVILTTAGKMLEDGALILDIGAQSTRPGAERLDAKEEWERLRSPLQQLVKEFPNAIISIDTFYSEVAQAAVESGAGIVNDISAGSLDPLMFEKVAALKVPYILMHMQGEPRTMQKAPSYTNVVSEVCQFFSEKMNQLQLMGVRDIILDPGFGFGKTLEHNYSMLKHFSEFGTFDKLLLAGVSRKGMIQKVIGTDAEHALNGTTAANMIALINGAMILRVHDVKEAREAIGIYQATRNAD